MFRLRSPDDDHLRSRLNRLANASLTYAEIGATLDGTEPSGYQHDNYRADLKPNSFDRAVSGLQHWQAHLGAGVNVFPPTAPIEEGTDVIVTARAGPLYALAPCRIVSVIDEPNRFGFAYGTLPGHPERGEEAFIVARDEEQHTTFEIIAFSHPADPLARIGSPIARRIQQHVTHAYLDALRRYADNER